ncbi:MAG TPA: hypothetical protein VN227_00150 [Methanoregula sp.]|nr:hypothetical protein [Methanoregula sp.]
MTNYSRVYPHRESGLSEVIGFVLIIGLIVVVASLYLTYGVPAQGRENEIVHMNEVKDQFVGYKLSLDSLFNNNKVGTTVSNSFTLGTAGGYSQGTISFIPIMSPVSSSGVIAINDRTKEPEILSFTSRSLILNNTVNDAVDLPAGIDNVPEHIYVTISGITPNDLSKDTYYGVEINGSGWLATVNLTPRFAYYDTYSIVQLASCPPGQVVGMNPGGGVNCLVSTPASNYTGSDISVTVIKGNIPTVQDLTVYKTISPGTYTVDLMDDAYGMKSSLQIPDNLFLSPTLDKFDTLHYTSHIKGNGNVTYGFTEMNYTVPPITLGSLEYRGQNSYWIPQTYYYQLGGVFLSQADGNTVYKLPPEISFNYNNDPVVTKKIVTVNINALTFDPNNRGIVGGSSSIQVKTHLDSVTMLPYAPGSANTKWITIAVNTTNNQSRTMWKNYFDYTATVAGVPHFTTGIAGNESYITIHGYDVSDTWNDINVIAARGTFTTTIHGVGGVIS